MKPDVAFELLEHSREIARTFQQHETGAMTEASYDPLRAFTDLAGSLERLPDFYDAGFDDGLGAGNVTTRIIDDQNRQVSVFINVTYSLPGAGKKTSVRGTKPTEVSATFYDPEATSPAGYLGKEEVKLKDLVDRTPDPEVVRNLSLLIETVRAIQPQS